MRKALFLLSVFAVAFFGFANTSEAATVDLTGWGWSSNIGWVSFNQKNTDTGAVYGVKLNDNGSITGQAWSDSVGWISFNAADVATCPLLSEDAGSRQARVIDLSDGGTRQVLGWARALIGNKGPGNLSTGDWDGCIHLSSGTGGNHPTEVADGSRGVTLAVINGNDTFVGKAWGGLVVGWLDFGPFLGGGTPPPGCPGCGGTPPICVGICPTGGSVPTVTLLANDSPSLAATTEDLVRLSWIVVDATSCTASMVSGPNPGWSGSKAVSGTTSQNLGVLAQNTYTFRLSCSNGNGTGFDDVTVTITEPVGPADVTVSCQAIDAFNNATTSVVRGTPVTWRATIAGGAPLFEYRWAGDGFSNFVVTSTSTRVINTSRTYTTTGQKEVRIFIQGDNVGNCSFATVQVRARPIFEPF